MQKYFRKSLMDTAKFTWNEVDNWYFCLSYMSNLRTVKVTESANICNIGDRVACTRETIVSWKCLCVEWTVVRESNVYYLTNLIFSEGSTDFCYSVTTLGNPWTYVKQAWCYNVLQFIMTWYMNLLTLSYFLRYAKRLVT